MKNIARLGVMLCLLIASIVCHADQDLSSDAGSTLRVEVLGLQDAEGTIYIAVYDSDDTWLGKETVHQQSLVIADARQDGVVSTDLILPPGEYALSIYFDINGNGKLDTNFIGIPKEPVALSNNARPKFGPPKYKDAVFTLADELLVQRISIEAI